MPYIERDENGAVVGWSRWPSEGMDEELPEGHPELKAFELRTLKEERSGQLRGVAHAKVLSEMAATLTETGETAINAATDEATVEKAFATAIAGLK